MNTAVQDSGTKGNDWKVTMNPDEVYRNPMSIAWTFKYVMPGDKVEDLYKRAKQNQWDSDEYLPWDTEVDPSKPLLTTGSSMYHRMPFFQKLSQTQREAFTAHSTAQLMSQFLHGEQGAVMTAACVTHSVPDINAKLYAATQTMDEARHVEVFAKYCEKVAIVYPMAKGLKGVIDATLKSDRFEKVMIGMNMIVESMALGSFNNVYRTTQCELLKKLMFGVMRDESRHVTFGHTYLGPLFAKMHPDDLEDCAEFAFQAVSMMWRRPGAATTTDSVDKGFLEVLENSNIDPADFFKGMKEAAEQGITQELPPGQIHSLNDLMMPALARVGLFTPTIRKKYDEAGITIFEDQRVLEAMEGGNPVA